MKLLKSFGWSTAATIISVLSSLSFYKIFSFFLGPPGVALLSHIQNLISIAITLPQDGVNKGMVKYISGEQIEGLTYKRHLLSAGCLLFFIYLVSLPFLYVLLQQTKMLPGFLRTPLFFALFSASTFFQIGVLFFLSLLVAAQKITVYALFSILNSIIGILLIFLGIRQGEFLACLALLFAPVCAFLFLSIYIYWFFKGRLSLRPGNFNIPALKDLSHFLFAAGSTLIFGRVVEFFVRILAISRFDVYQTGLWQSTVKLSDGYSSLFTGVLGVIFYPKIASLINNNKRVQPVFLKISFFIMAVVLAGLLTVFVFQKTILSLVFDVSFIPARRFLNYQLLADAFKLSSWLMVYLIMARAKLKIYFMLQVVSAINYIVLLAIFCQKYGVMGLAMATLWRNVLYFIITLWITIYYFSRSSQHTTQTL